MSNNWILDVLADIKSFALRNDLSLLAEQLDDTVLVAASEIASKEGRARKALQADAAECGTTIGRFAGGDGAR